MSLTMAATASADTARNQGECSCPQIAGVTLRAESFRLVRHGRQRPPTPPAASSSKGDL